MERPRLSSGSCDSDGDGSETSLSLSTDTDTPPPQIAVNNLVVHKDGTGILKGNVTTFTVNQYIVPNKDSWDRKVVEEFVTDAVKISSDTNKTFFPQLESVNAHLPLGNKEDVDGLQKRWCYLIGALVSLSFVTLVCTSLFSLTSYHSLNRQPPPPPDRPVDPGDQPGAPRMMSRLSWVAQPPLTAGTNNTLPVHTVVVCHTAGDACQTTAGCILTVRLLQQYHIESRKWDDIAYNFLVGGDGAVYVGRGWDLMGAHTKGHNLSTLGVAFIGTYTRNVPSPVQIEAFSKLISLGVRINKIAENYSLVAQCQLQPTAAPGLALAHEMTSWPHFNASLPIMCTTL